MPTNCTPAIKNAAAAIHAMPINELFQAATNYYGSNPIKPIKVTHATMAAFIANLDCTTDCVIFTAVDSATDLSDLRMKADKQSVRFNTTTGKYTNNPATGDIQTTFSVALLSYFVDKQSDFYFYKINGPSGKRLAFSVLAETANHGDVGPYLVEPKLDIA